MRTTKPVLRLVKSYPVRRRTLYGVSLQMRTWQRTIKCNGTLVILYVDAPLMGYECTNANITENH
jgi:hypothetical protein